MRRIAMGLIVLALLPSPAWGGDDTKRAALIDDILALSGFNDAVDALPDSLAAQFDTAPPDVDPAFIRAYLDAVASVVRADLLRVAMERSLAAHYDAERYRAFRDMLATPLVRRMTQIESAKRRPGESAEFDDFRAETLPGLAGSRRSLLRRIDRASGTTDTVIALASNATVVVFIGEAAKGDRPPAHLGVTTAGLEAARHEMRRNLGDRLAQDTEAYLAYLYRDVTDEDLAAYGALLDTDLGRWFADIFQGAWVSALDLATISALERMGVGGTRTRDGRREIRAWARLAC